MNVEYTYILYRNSLSLCRRIRVYACLGLVGRIISLYRLLYAAINSVYTPGKVFPRARDDFLSRAPAPIRAIYSIMLLLLRAVPFSLFILIHGSSQLSLVLFLVYVTAPGRCYFSRLFFAPREHAHITATPPSCLVLFFFLSRGKAPSCYCTRRASSHGTPSVYSHIFCYRYAASMVNCLRFGISMCREEV